MKVLTVLGTRPEIIRLSRIIPKLDDLCEHILVHTGQNYDRNLNEIFFEEMGIRVPDYYLGAQGSLGEQSGIIFSKIQQLIEKEKPDKFLILGDTNSALSAFIAKRMSYKVYHMEAGNRCYDDRVPEEVNRRVIDHSSDILMPYTERSRQNLLKEGFEGNRIFVTGNPILEVLSHYDDQIANSEILNKLKLSPKNYFLITMHRAENVDIIIRLKNFTIAFDLLQKKYQVPIIISTHPHTKSRMDKLGITNENPNINYLPPFGLFDFVSLEKNAKLVLSDSGTVQEECCIFHVPTVTIRDVTERPETVECGSNILSGDNPDKILLSVNTVLEYDADWTVPREYLEKKVSQTVIKLLMGFQYH